MKLQNIEITRTYLSEKPRPGAFLVALFFILLFFIASALHWNQSWPGDQNYLASFVNLIENSNYISAVYSLFIHGDAKHLFSNSFLFFILAGFVQSYFGWFAFPFLAMLSGVVINFIVVFSMPPETRILGVSGVVFWLGGFWLTMYLLIDIKRNWTQRILRTFGVGLMLFFPAQAFDPSTSYLSHMYGFVLGVFLALIFYFIQRKKFQKAIRYKIIPEELDPEDLVPATSSKPGAEVTTH